MRTRTLVALLSLASAPAVAAGVVPLSVVQAIVSDLDAAGDHVPADRVQRALKAVDIDGDGRPDYLFSKEKLGAGWCGTGGCWVQLWLGRGPHPPLKIFDAQVREIRFRTAPRGKVVDVDLHGSVCHTFGAHACPASFRWDGGLGRLVETSTADGKGLVRFLRPVEALDASPPSAIAAAFRSAVAACREGGGTAADPERPLTVPDVDGDGIRDWIIPEFYCELPEANAAKAPSMMLFATAGNAAQPVLAASAARLEIDTATTPATVFAVDMGSCSPEAMQPTACKRTRMIWATDKRRLIAQPLRPGRQ